MNSKTCKEGCNCVNKVGYFGNCTAFLGLPQVRLSSPTCNLFNLILRPDGRYIEHVAKELKDK